MKPIDMLSKNLNVSDDFDIEINEPYTVFKVIYLLSTCLCHQSKAPYVDVLFLI